MTRAAIYVRVSTTRQAENDLSLSDQIGQCRTYCGRHGWEVVEVFSEPGASALDDDRPVFQEMIFKAKRADRPFDRVVVHSLSRFSRDTLHSELYVRELVKAGAQLVSITQDVGHDGSGDFIRKMLNVFDEHQSRENAKHTHRAMCENARQGFWNGSYPPFGYRVEVKEKRGNKEKKVLAIDDSEAPIVRKSSHWRRVRRAAQSESRPSRLISTNGAFLGAGCASRPAGSTGCCRQPPTTASTISIGGTAGTGSPARRRSG